MRRVFARLLVALVAVSATAAHGGPVPVSAEFVSRAADPRGGNAGFESFSRLPNGKALAFAGFGRTPIGGNAVALYDPVADSWQITVPHRAWVDTYDVRGRTFLGNRSGNPALVVDGEYWALDGDRGFSPLGNFRGTLDTQTWQWRIEDSATAFTPTGTAPSPRLNGAVGWIGGADIGFLFGGTRGTAATDSLSRVTRNPSGTPRFTLTEFNGTAGAAAFAGATRVFAIGNQHWVRQGKVHVYGGIEEDTAGAWKPSAALRELDVAMPRMTLLHVNDLPDDQRVDGGGVMAYHDPVRDIAVVTDGLLVNVFDYATARWLNVPVLTAPDPNRQSPTPPSPDQSATGPGTWTRYPTSFNNGTEAPSTTWYNLTWDTARNRAYAISWEARLFTFEPGAGAWRQLSRLAFVSDFHNRTITYDPVNDRLWVSDGTGSVPPGFRYYDFATGTWTNLGSVGQPSYQAVMLFDPVHKRLIAFGGWQQIGVAVFDLAPIASSWRAVPLPGGPSYVSEYQKFTAWRTVLDSKRNRILFVDTDGALWSLPLDLSGWQRIPTSAPLPPPSAQYVYDTVNDTIVGWAPSESLVTGDGGASLRETWLLPLSSLQWRKAANRIAGDNVPPYTSHVEFAMVYDPQRQETLLHSDDGGDQFLKQTWTYRHPSPPPGAPGGASLASFYSPEVDQLIILGANAKTFGLKLNFGGAAAPGAPTNVTATPGDAQATVSFSPPASDGGSPITGYAVTSNPAGGVDAHAGSTATTHTITGLTNGVAYTFTVKATNAIGSGPASAASNSVTPATVPGAPTNVVATAADAAATVTFSAPASNGGSPITGYTVVSNPPGGVDANAGSTATTHTISGLTNGVAYTFTVRATNAVGSGPASAPSNSVTPSVAAKVPSAPTNVVAAAGNAEATVTFAAPASDGGSPITGYRVASQPAGGVDTNAGTTGTTHRITGLTNGVAYTFTVTATNAMGTGPASAPSNSVTPATVPGAPTNVWATAGNAQATVAFAAPVSNGGSPITGYSVASSPPGGVDAHAGSTGTAHTVTGLTNGVAYTFTVTAANAVGSGPASAPSNSVTPATVPGAPTNVSATAGNAQATVTFAPPGSNGGSPITGYRVVSNPAGGVDANAGSTGTTHTVSGLSNGVAYTFTVTATNAAGTGPASAPSNSVTPAAPQTVPGAPTNVVATAGNAQASVAFTAPASDGGSAITGYTVTSNPAGGVDAHAGTTSTTHTVTGLTNGVAYTFTVRATNAIGTGAASAASNSIVPKWPSTITAASATGSGPITVQVSGGGAACGFASAQFVTASAVAPPPAGVAFPHGLVDFTLRDCTSKGTVTMTFTYPSALAAQAKEWHYGPQPPNRPASWYTLAAPNRLTMSGAQVSFQITDGKLGDDDLAGNGTIDGTGGVGVGP